VDGNIDTEGTLIAETGIDVGGTSELGGDVTAEANDVDLGGDVTLTADVVITGANVNVTGNVDGAFDLTLAGTSDVSGTIGTTIVDLTVNTGPLTAGTIDITGNLDANQNVETDTGAINVDGSIDTEGTLIAETGIDVGGTSELGGDVTAEGGGATFTGAVTLTANVTLSVGGDLVFGTTVDSDAIGTPREVTVSNAVNATFTGVIGNVAPLASLRQTTGTGTTAFNGGTVNGDVNVTTDSITLSTATLTTNSTTAGGSSLNSQDSVTMNSGLDATASTISILANQDGAGGDDFLQTAGGLCTTTNDTATAVTITVGGAAGNGADARIRAITVGTTDGRVTVTATGGAIIDEDNDDATAEITAGQAVLSAADGIGTGANHFDVTVTSADVVNTTSGGIFVTDTADGLTLAAIVGANAVDNGAGAAAPSNSGEIRASSPLTIRNDAITSGGMTYTATDSAAAGDDLTVTNNATVRDTTAALTLNGGDDVDIQSGTPLYAATTLTIDADSVAGDSDGATVTIAGDVHEKQRVEITGGPTGGTFTLSFGTTAPTTTADIPYDATGVQVRDALITLGDIGPGNVSVAGGPLPGTPVEVVFVGTLAETDVAEMTTTSSLTGGTAPAVTVATAFNGGIPALMAADVRINTGNDNDTILLSTVALELDTIQATNSFNVNAGGNEAQTRTISVGGAPASDACSAEFQEDQDDKTIGDVLILYDTNRTVQRTYTVTSANVQVDPIGTFGAGGTLEYLSVETLQIVGGSANDTFDLQNGGLPDVVQIDGGTGGQDDYVNIAGTANDDSVTIDTLGGGAPFELTGIDRFTVQGGGGDDVINNKTSIPYVVEGGGGNDTIVSGAATLVPPREHVFMEGGSGDDTLIGSGGNIVFNGGPGTDSVQIGPGDNNIIVAAEVICSGTGGCGLATAARDSLTSVDVCLWLTCNFQSAVDLNATITQDVQQEREDAVAPVGSNLIGTQVGDGLDVGTGIYMSLVKNPTAVGSDGQVAELPGSETWIHEWDSYWVELWTRTTDASGVTAASVDLAYDPQYFTATEIDHGSVYVNETSGSIDDGVGLVSSVGGGTVRTDVGGDGAGYALLGRVKFESLPEDQVPVDAVNQFIGPYDLGLDLSNPHVEVAGDTAVEPGLGRSADTELWAVVYDIDDDDRIGFGDFAYFANAFQESVAVSDSPFALALDFDRSGRVDFGDFAYFTTNFQQQKGSAVDLQFPTSFTQRWTGNIDNLDGTVDVGDMLDAATATWQHALELDEPIDVQLVFHEFDDAQLGEARILDVDPDGRPVAGRVTIDNDAAGLGWYASQGEPVPTGKYDLYTVLLHEIGHTLGFTPAYAGFDSYVQQQDDGSNLFVAPGFTATLDADAQHLAGEAHPDDLMNATLDPGTRKYPSQADAAILNFAYAAAAAGATGFDPGVVSMDAALFATVQAGDVSEASTLQVPQQVSGDSQSPDRDPAWTSLDARVQYQLVTDYGLSQPRRHDSAVIQTAAEPSEPADDGRMFPWHELARDGWQAADLLTEIKTTTLANSDTNETLDAIFAEWDEDGIFGPGFFGG